MAVYSKLLLSAGGGILPTVQRIELSEDTRSIFIGVGETGIDCIRSIRTKINNTYKSDNPYSPIKEFSYARFLGVADYKEYKIYSSTKKADAPLDEDELFLIKSDRIQSVHHANPNVFVQARRLKEKLSWCKDIEKHLTNPITNEYIWFMSESEEFMEKLARELQRVLCNNSGHDVRVCIHIFSDFSDIVSSSCLLDICYMIRSIFKTFKNISFSVLGYFAMPDVVILRNKEINCSDLIKKVSYLSMKELDYWMNIRENGGEVIQKYYSDYLPNVEWNVPPFDFCHLIGATDTANNVICNAYDSAVNTVSNYVAYNLMEKEIGDWPERYSEYCVYADQIKYENEMKNCFDFKDESGNLYLNRSYRYCAFGHTCVYLPLREINTYLATGLFKKFSINSTNLPGRVDVESFARETIGPSAEDINGIYDSLMREVRENASNDYAPYQGDWKDVKDYGNQDMIRNYTNQTAEKKNVIEANTKSLLTQDNDRSLINRINCSLIDICKDYTRGPIFANGIIDAAYSHNLINIIDGLLAENKGKWDHEYMQKSLRETDAENAWAAFEERCNKPLFNNASKELCTFEFYLMLFEQHRLDLYMYEHIDKLLRTLKSQISDLAASFYEKLSRVLGNLIETFSANASALETMISTKTDYNVFEIPLVTIDEIQEDLDTQVEAVNIEGMLSKFMDLLIEERDEWITEDENRIAKLVNDFFVKDAFSGFANKTITTYLREKYTKKYGDISPEQLVDYIYEDYAKLFYSLSCPLIDFRWNIWNDSESYKQSHILYPEISHEIKAAIRKISGSYLYDAGPNDRIIVEKLLVGFPFCACAKYVDFISEFADSHILKSSLYPITLNDEKNLQWS